MLAIHSIAISDVDCLKIGSRALGQVKQLTLQNIGELEYSDSFDQLQADSVKFSNVTFLSGRALKPASIKSQLDIVGSHLANISVTVDSLPVCQSMSIKDSVLSGFSLKTNVETFTLDGNRFIQLPSSTAGLMDVAYSHSLNLKNNQFIGISNSTTFLPNVSSSTQSFVFEFKDEAVDSKQWLGHLEVEFTGTSSEKGEQVLQSNCSGQKGSATPNTEMLCSNVQSNVEFHKNHLETKLSSGSFSLFDLALVLASGSFFPLLLI